MNDIMGGQFLTNKQGKGWVWYFWTMSQLWKSGCHFWIDVVSSYTEGALNDKSKPSTGIFSTDRAKYIMCTSEYILRNEWMARRYSTLFAHRADYQSFYIRPRPAIERSKKVTFVKGFMVVSRWFMIQWSRYRVKFCSQNRFKNS